METSPNEIVPEPRACGGIVLGTIACGPVSCANVLTPQYFVVWLRRAALLVVVAALAAGCAGGPAEPGPVTLVLKHAKILGPSDPVPGLLREFEKRHPGVRVQAESLSWNSDDQHQFFVINLEGRGAAFDVMMLDVVWVAEFARAGWLLDLSPWVTRAELAPHFPSTIEPATWNGRVWAMPWLMNVGVLYYRTDLLAKYRLPPPRTWEALVDQVVRVRGAERDGRLDGVVWQGRQYEGLTVNALEAIWANGGRMLVPARADRLRREPVVGDRGRRGAEPAPLRRRARDLPAQLAVRHGPLPGGRLARAWPRRHGAAAGPRRRRGQRGLQRRRPPRRQ